MNVPELPSAELPDLLRPREEPLAPWKRVLFLAGAILAFVAGLAGWLVPIVTGIPFWVAGIVLLAMASQRTARLVNSLERRLPEAWRLKLRHGIVKVPIRKLREAVNPAE
jgi:Flp pilus assembly protein TadB